MRFFAALVVFTYHLESFFYWRSALPAASRVFTQGPVGVSFFFILSGFVLTWSHHPRDRAGSFFRRRLARIGPLHVFTWLLMGVVALALAVPPPRTGAFASLALLTPWSPTWSANLSMNNPSWSLGCELFFYALFPALYGALTRCSVSQRRTISAGCVVAVIGLAAVLAPATGQMAHWLLYFFPPTRLLEFVLGMALALEVAEGRLPHVNLLAATAAAVAGYLGAAWAPSAYSPVAVTVIPFALLIVAAAQADVARRPSFLRSPLLVMLGAWSFALYLVHWPVLTVLAHLVSGQLGIGATVLVGLVALGMSVAAAGALHRAVERPLESRLRGIQPRLASATS